MRHSTSCEKAANETLLPSDKDWPDALDGLSSPPKQLFIRSASRQACLSRPGVAIVGTRGSTRQADCFAEHLASQLASRDIVVVSGGAHGIDAAAHRGALEVGGKTMAILPTPLSRPYPAAHLHLFDQIAQQGMLLSEHNDASQIFRSSFIKRNRLIACLTRAVIVVQAPLRSGALSTASWARQLGTPVYVVPTAPWESLFSGNLRLMQNGGRLLTSVDDVLTELELPTTKHVAVKEQPRLDGLPTQQQRILALLQKRVCDVDTLATESGYPAAHVQAALLELRILSLVRQTSDGCFATSLRKSQLA